MSQRTYLMTQYSAVKLQLIFWMNTWTYGNIPLNAHSFKLELMIIDHALLHLRCGINECPNDFYVWSDVGKKLNCLMCGMKVHYQQNLKTNYRRISQRTRLCVGGYWIVSFGFQPSASPDPPHSSTFRFFPAFLIYGFHSKAVSWQTHIFSEKCIRSARNTTNTRSTAAHTQ